MNKLSRFVSMAFTNGCYVIGGLVLVHAVWGGEVMTKSSLVSLILLSLLCGILQTLCFSELIIKKMAYCWRTTIFGVALLAVLSVMAVSFGWFPTNQPGPWITFTGIFLVILFALAAVFQLYYRHSGKKYNERLNKYHTKQSGADHIATRGKETP